MLHEFKGSLRKIPQDEYSSLSNSRQFPEPPNPYIKSEAFYRTDRSEYSSVNKLQTTSNYDREMPPKYIYDKNILVKLSRGESMEHEMLLRVEMEVVYSKSKQVYVNLSDDGDHRFLWCTCLKEKDYPAFKNEQKLKVQFGDFDNFLIKILDSLLQNPKKYICRFEYDNNQKGSFKVLQSNEFKQNLNLQLKFKEADNEQLIRYMNHKMFTAECREADMSIEIEKRGKEISQQRGEIEALKGRLDEFEIERKSEVSDLRNAARTQVTGLKEEHINKESDIRKQAEQEKREVVRRYQGELSRVKEKYEELLKKYETSAECNERLESKNRALESKTTIMSAENQSLKNNYHSASEQLGTLQKSCIEKEKENTQLQCKVESLTQQIKDKEIIIESTKEIKTNQSSQVQILESSIESLKKQLSNQQTALKVKAEECAKLKSSYEEEFQKNHVKTKRLLQKDAVVIAIHTQFEEMKVKNQKQDSLIQELREEKSKAERDSREQVEELAKCKAQIQENAKTIGDQNDIMKHLQKQLTSQSIGSTRVGGPMSSIMQSNYRPSFNYETPSVMTKSSLSPSIPMPVGDRIQPEIKKYSGTSNFQLTNLKTEKSQLINQEEEPEDYREHTLRVNPVKYRSPSQSKS